MDDKQLKKCPFCGGEAEIKTKWKANGDCITKIECFCGASLEIIGSIPYKEELQKRWNTRKPMEKILEILEKFRAEEEIRGFDGRAKDLIFDIKEEGGLNGQM